MSLLDGEIGGFREIQSNINSVHKREFLIENVILGTRSSSLTQVVERRANEIARASVVIRGVVVLNYVLFGLAWCPWFWGSDTHWKVSDQLFGQMRVGNVRVDMVWMTVSTLGLALAAVVCWMKLRTRDGMRTNLYVCMAGIVGFFLFVYFSLTVPALN